MMRPKVYPLQHFTRTHHRSDPSPSHLPSPGIREGHSDTTATQTPLEPRSTSWPPPGNVSMATRAARGSRATWGTMSSQGSSAPSLTPAQVAQSRSNSFSPAVLHSLSIPETADDSDDDESVRKSLSNASGQSWDPPVPTMKVFQQFDKVVGRRIAAEVEITKQRRLWESRAIESEHAQTLQELRRWIKAKTERETPRGFFKSILRLSSRPHRPSDERLVEMSKFYYPPRADLKVYICDFGEGRFKKREVTFGQIEQGLSKS